MLSQYDVPEITLADFTIHTARPTDERLVWDLNQDRETGLYRSFTYPLLKIVVVSERLEAHAMLECDGECYQHVAEGYLGEQVFCCGFRSLVGVQPDQSCETRHDAGQLRPVPATFTVSLVCC